MQALDIVLNFFREGGFFLYPIALVWVIGLVIAFERFGFILRWRARETIRVGSIESACCKTA